MKENTVLQVREDLCLGCGLCAESCSRQAISLPSGKARINSNSCNRCGICIDICPRGAIIESIPVSKDELQATVTGLKDRTEDIIDRIEKLKAQ